MGLGYPVCKGDLQTLMVGIWVQIPTIGFLYIAGYIGSVGRDYLTRIKGEAKPRDKEIIIDVPLALKCSLAGLGWPAKAITELRNGTLTEDDVCSYFMSCSPLRCSWQGCCHAVPRYAYSTQRLVCIMESGNGINCKTFRLMGWCGSVGCEVA